MANKQDIVAKVIETAGLTKKDAKNATNAVLDAIKGFVTEGEKVQLIGFGTFDVRERSARKGRNPQTGEEIAIPASKAVGFKAGKEFKAGLI